MTLLAYIFAVLKNAIYGLSVFFTGALSDSVDVLDILALRFLLSFVILFVLKLFGIVKISVKIKEIFLVTRRRKAMKNLLLAALFEPVIEIFFETLGISMTTSVTAAVILSLSPVANCVSESLILKEKTTLLQKVFLGIGIVGVAYIALNTDTSTGKDSVAGILCIILAGVFGSLYMVFSRKSRSHFNALEITYTSAFMGMIFFNGANIIRHLLAGDVKYYFVPYFDIGNLIGFLYLAVVSSVLATCMNNFALGRMQASTMSAFGGFSTLVTVVAGVFLNNEPIYYFHYIGFALILIRMIGVSYISIKKEKMKNA